MKQKEKSLSEGERTQCLLAIRCRGGEGAKSEVAKRKIALEILAIRTKIKR